MVLSVASHPTFAVECFRRAATDTVVSGRVCAVGYFSDGGVGLFVTFDPNLGFDFMMDGSESSIRSLFELVYDEVCEQNFVSVT